ncbi:hypothetical protein Dsin_014316 [Dipteronia sinensis]|uniref:Uncharacterized protein n=1 Tax=Dipteronia sinensis TaxID=43782 RepID=A0AAE0ALJ2_9ROSI|nr:hypothetical protein Dsin_014316 [Dipteronia sinensis]
MDPNASKNDHIGEQATSDQQIMQMNQAAAQQILPMNDQAAVQQLMQMNQAAAQQILPMNDQAAAQQFMQMNDQMIQNLEEQRIKIIENRIRERNADVARFRPLYRAIREKNWKAVEDFVTNDPEALHKDITETGLNIFHLLSLFDEAIGLVENFVSKVPPESLERVNIGGINALTIAALSGNAKAAKVFVRKHKKLLKTAEVEDLSDKSGAKLLKILIKSNLFGIPLQEEKNPYPLPKRVGGDIEKQTDRFQCCSAESKTFGFLQAKLGL